MRSEFEKAFPIPAHWIEFNEKLNKYYCPYSADYEASKYQAKWEVWQHRQTEVDELQKRVEILEAALESERWDREAGFKVFFKARDMRGGWHGFAKKPEYYEKGGYWTNGGKAIYLQGDEWCDEETALNSLAAVKEQALKGGCDEAN